MDEQTMPSRDADEASEATPQSPETESATLPAPVEPIVKADAPEMFVPDDEEEEETNPALMDTTPLAPLPEAEKIIVTPTPKPATTDPILMAVQRCHVGAVRVRNEDSCQIFTALAGGQTPAMPFGLYIVADGMGGHLDGHEASRTAARLSCQHILESVYLPLIRASDMSLPMPPLQEVMTNAVIAANQAVYNPDPEKDSGTTLTAVLILGRRLYWAHVGDSRAYLLTDDTLTLLTEDHSYVQRLIKTGQITEEEAAVHPHRNVLYRAVGQGPDLEVKAKSRPLPSQGMLLICSDGLWGLVPDEQLQEILTQPEALSVRADNLIEAALAAGGHDNISAVVVTFNF